MCRFIGRGFRRLRARSFYALTRILQMLVHNFLFAACAAALHTRRGTPKVFPFLRINPIPLGESRHTGICPKICGICCRKLERAARARCVTPKFPPSTYQKQQGGAWLLPRRAREGELDRRAKRGWPGPRPRRALRNHAASQGREYTAQQYAARNPASAPLPEHIRQKQLVPRNLVP